MINQISVEQLPIITHKSIPVVTSELLAKLYGSTTNNIKKNYSRNSDRFIEGKHYFIVTGEELKEFKNSVTFSHLVDKRTPRLTLWTERGAARHAKMLETDQAWEVFEKLEDCYFSQRKPVQQADMFVTEPHPLNVTIPNEGRWLVIYQNGMHKLVNVDGHNVVKVDFINKLQRDTNLLIQLMKDYYIRTQVLKGDKNGDILNVPLITK